MPESVDGQSYINTAALRPIISRHCRRGDRVQQVCTCHWRAFKFDLPMCHVTHRFLSHAQCYVIRNKSGRNMLHPLYTLYSEDGDRFLMAAKVRTNSHEWIHTLVVWCRTDNDLPTMLSETHGESHFQLPDLHGPQAH